MAARRRAASQRLTADPHGAGVVAVDTEDRPGDLAATGADQPRQRDDLPDSDVEGDVGEHPFPRQSLDLQRDLTGRGVRLGEQRAEVAADHRPDDVVHGEGLDRVGTDEPTVAHDRHPLADREDLLEPVGDEQDRGTLRAQCADDLEQPSDLRGGQCCRRLVHHEDPGVERERLGDLHHLLVGDGQSSRGAPRVNDDPEALEHPRSVAVHLRAVDPTPTRQRLASDEHVLRDSEVREQGRLLVDDRDPCHLRGARPGEGDLVAVEDHAP